MSPFRDYGKEACVSLVLLTYRQQFCQMFSKHYNGKQKMRSFRLVILFANSSRFLQFAEAVLSFQSATISKKISVTSIALWVLNNVSSDVFRNSSGVAPFILLTHAARKVSVFGAFLVCILPNSDYFLATVSNPNAGKYWPEKLWTRTLFMQWHYYRKDEEELIAELEEILWHWSP